MRVEGIDYVYLETRNFGAAARFWQRLGYDLALDLGTSGRLDPPGGGPGIFLEEVSPETPLASGIYLRAGDDSMEVDAGVERVGDIVDTHWGTTLQTVRDPDGREFIIQHTPERRPG